MPRLTKSDTSTSDSKHRALALLTAAMLVFSVLSTVGAILLPSAFAEKGDNEGEQGNSMSDHEDRVKKGQPNQNKTSTTSSTTNSTKSVDEESGANAKSYGKGKSKNMTAGSEDQSVKPSWIRQLNETAEEKHAKHLKMNASFTGPYAVNFTYTLSANGTATAIGNSSYVGDSEVLLEMSVWKSTPNQVKMDVMSGTVMVDEEALEIHSGHAHYWIKTGRLLVIAFLVQNGTYVHDDGSNETSTTNQKFTTNQTSITADAEAEDSKESSVPNVRVLKLWMKIPEGAAQLPTDESDEAVEMEMMSPQSKLSSMWFFEMSGNVSLT